MNENNNDTWPTISNRRYTSLVLQNILLTSATRIILSPWLIQRMYRPSFDRRWCLPCTPFRSLFISSKSNAVYGGKIIYLEWEKFERSMCRKRPGGILVVIDDVCNFLMRKHWLASVLEIRQYHSFCRLHSMKNLSYYYIPNRPHHLKNYRRTMTTIAALVLTYNRSMEHIVSLGCYLVHTLT